MSLTDVGMCVHGGNAASMTCQSSRFDTMARVATFVDKTWLSLTNIGACVSRLTG